MPVLRSTTRTPSRNAAPVTCPSPWSRTRSGPLIRARRVAYDITVGGTARQGACHVPHVRSASLAPQALPVSPGRPAWRGVAPAHRLVGEHPALLEVVEHDGLEALGVLGHLPGCGLGVAGEQGRP